MKMKITITEKELSDIAERVAERLLDPNQFGGPWFNGSREDFEIWSGDIFLDVITYTLETVGCTIEEE